MSIGTKPFTAVSLADVEDLIARGIPESQQLDYKRDLALSDRGKVEILKDVSALANAEGGTLIYGVAEGEDDRRGYPVAVPGLGISPDSTLLALTTLLADGFDERLSGVLLRFLPTGDNRHVLVVRVPASPLAPHMISIPTSGPRFYLRSNSANVPMNMRQVKEAVMRRETALERAEQLVASRLDVLREAASAPVTGTQERPASTRSQIVVHVVPLFPAPGGWGIGDPDVDAKLRRMPPLGREEPYSGWRPSLRGYGAELRGTAHVLFLRKGAAVELQRFDAVETRASGAGTVRRFPAYLVERAVRDTLKHCAELTADGLLPLPVLVQVSILGAAGSLLLGAPHADESERPIEDDEVLLTPVIIHAWDERQDVERGVFNEMWQAWGFAQSWNYRDGRPIQYDTAGDPYPLPLEQED